nr:hypothetical protein Iba_chr15cCG3860 [Ipomoea batatas]
MEFSAFMAPNPGTGFKEEEGEEERLFEVLSPEEQLVPKPVTSWFWDGFWAAMEALRSRGMWGSSLGGDEFWSTVKCWELMALCEEFFLDARIPEILDLVIGSPRSGLR